MGRRKIEIKAIKDDRNRSVTFLKRKGGLFKKAHELSVLCSVDVAVIIFGHNKKLYEFSSGDINEMIGRYSYYGGPHERKGPADFQGKDNDDDEEEPDDAAIEEQLNEQQNAPHLHHPQAYNQMRPRASASPPNTNGLLPHHYRQHTPQPPHPGSRPVSRNHNPISRPSSTLGHHPSQHPANGYRYVPAPPHNGHPMQGQHHPAQFPSQYQPHPQHFQGHQQMQFLPPDQRRSSMPPYAAQQQVPQQQHVERLAPQATMKVERHSPSPPQAQEPVRSQSDSLQPQPIRAMGSKSKSIFTPIDAGGSSIAASWGFASNNQELMAANKPTSPETRSKSNPQPQPLAGRPQFAPPQRTDSMSSIGGGSKRPRLNLQIPSEQSDDDAGVSGTTSSPQPSGETASTAQNKGSEATNTSHSGVILPPPSPSTLLSASANGPPNPFARPLPPSATNPNNNGTSFSAGNNNIETPISALPSRFLNEGMLPSPSSFYPEWGFTRSGGGDGNMLPSPLTFPTPVQGSGSGFSTTSKDASGNGSGADASGEGADRKRKTPEAETPGGAGATTTRAGKKVKADS